MKHGFSEKGDAYYVQALRAPDNFRNYLYNEQYYMEVDQNGQGISRSFDPVFVEHSRERRFFYAFDKKDQTVYNLLGDKNNVLISYQTTHYLHASEMESQFRSFHSRINTFVPLHETMEVWEINLTNTSNEALNFKLFSGFSVLLKETTGIVADYDKERGIIIATGNPDSVFYDDVKMNELKRSYVYLATDVNFERYDTSEYHFMGDSKWGEIPSVVLQGACKNTLAEHEPTITCCEHELFIGVGEVVKLHVIFGITKSLDILDKLKSTLTTSNLEKYYEEIKQFWISKTSTLKILTPHKELNAFTNYWIQKQIDFCSRLNRISCYYPIRNPLQDSVGYALIDPTFAQNKMLEIARTQEISGYLHMWQKSETQPPLGPIGMCHLKHKDSQIWLVVCICQIAQISGDITWLDRTCSYSDNKKEESLYEHMVRALTYMELDRGEHGLCLMGDGDWNDPLNGAGRLGRGESTWTTMGFVFALKCLLPICELRGDFELVEYYRQLIQELDNLINRYCWDGDWYIAGYSDNGTPFGTHSDNEGKILLNAQSWAIMSGVVKGERLKKLLTTIDSLNTPIGPRTITPGFKRWNPIWGRISYWVYGSHENGGVYCHASMFKVYADYILKRSKEGYDTILKTLPFNPENPIEKSRQLPIIVPNCYFGNEASINFGRSTGSKATGTASWLLYLIIEEMLGVKSTVEGIVIEPCIDEEWENYQVFKTYKNATYDIEVKVIKNSEVPNTKVFINGELHKGNVLPYNDNENYNVLVFIIKN